MNATPTTVDDTYRIVTDLLAAAEAGSSITLTPRQCLILAEKVSATRSKASAYLEAVVAQAGGRLHVDTRWLATASGGRVRYRPDHDRGHGGLLYNVEAP